MTPYYQDDLVTIYHGDCREVLPGLTYDSTVTDPPYGTGGLSVLGDEAYPHDVIPGDKPCVAFGAARTHVRDMAAFPKPPDRVMVWTPRFSWSKASDGGVAYRWHPIYCWDVERTRRGDEPTEDVFRDAIVGTESRRTSSVTKPVPLMRKLLALVPGVAADPFLGRGATLVAAKALGRKAIGIEIDERWCEIAAQRCSQEVLGLSA